MPSKKAVGDRDTGRQGKPKDKKKWTIMVYMAGDNNLSDEMIRAIIELRNRIKSVGNNIVAPPKGPKPVKTKVSKKNGIGVLVEFDGEHPVVPSRRYDLTFDVENPAAYMKTSEPANVAPTPATLPKPAFASPVDPPLGLTERRICDFIDHCIETRPAKNYLLILSGHSDAFLGRSLLLDQEPSGIATLQGIRQVVAGKFKPQLDILAFDGCVMNTLEVVYEFQDSVKTWIGSQGSIPNYTWDYGKMAEELMKCDKNKLNEAKIVDAITKAVEDYNHPFAFGGRSVDVSVLDISKVRDFSLDLNNAASFMFTLLYWFRPNTVIGSRIMQVLLQAHWNCQSTMFGQSVDLIDLLTRVRVECIKAIRQHPKVLPEQQDGNVSEEPFSEKEIETLNKTLSEGDVRKPPITHVFIAIYHGCSVLLNSIKGLVKRGVFVGADYRFCQGVSIFLPWSYVALHMSRTEYEKLAFTKDLKCWYAFLEIYMALTARPMMQLNKIDEFEKAVELFFTYLEQFRLELLNIEMRVKKEKAGLLDLFTLELINDLVSEPPYTKLNPPFNRGFESYLQYFSKTNNVNPDLDISGDFPD